MSRWRLFWYNPYKLRLIVSRLSRSWRRTRAHRQIQTLVAPGAAASWQLPEEAGDFYGKRRRPCFYFDSEQLEQIVAATPAAAREALLAQARQQLLARRLAFRGQAPLTLTEQWTWPTEIGLDPEWVRDFHRLEWLTEGLLAAHYGDAADLAPVVAEALSAWWQANPPGSLPWQEPFEVAQRSATLCWLFFLGLHLPVFPRPAIDLCLLAILAHGLWLAQHLEYQTPNNHLLIAAVRLAQLGLLFPEFPPARRWWRCGQGIVLRELAHQILPDGFHAELSVFYHRLILETLLEYAILLDRQPLPKPTVLVKLLPKLLLTLALLRRPDGSFPELGDGFPQDVLLRHDLAALGKWVGGAACGKTEFNLKTLWLLNGHWPVGRSLVSPSQHSWPQAGYVLLQRRVGGHQARLLVDAGPFGLAAAPGHGHADCLNLLLDLDGRPLLVDPGSYSFADVAWRGYWRGTRAHNTVVLDGLDQTPLHGLFGVGRPARGQLDTLFLGAGLRLIAASHDGYRRLSPPVRHRRLLLEVPPVGWLVLDLLQGQGQRRVSQLWHLPPGGNLHLEDQAVRWQAPQGPAVLCRWAALQSGTLRIIEGQTEPPQGWVALEAGVKQAAPVLAWETMAPLPVAVATLLHLEPASEVTFQLQPCQSGLVVELASGAGTLSWLVRLESSGPLASPPWEVDGDLFVCWQRPPETEFLLCGRAVREQGRALLQAAAPTPGLSLRRTPRFLEVYGQAVLPVCIATAEPLPVRWAQRALRPLFDVARQELWITELCPATGGFA